MDCRRSLFLLTFLVCFFQAQGKNRYALGDTLNVWASVLNLREQPGTNGKALGKIPYGSNVVIVDHAIGQIAYTDKVGGTGRDFENGEKPDPIYINGYWVKVSFNGKQGYVFDGYLSKVKTFPAFKRDHGYDLTDWAVKTNNLRLFKRYNVDEVGGYVDEEYGGSKNAVRVLISRQKCGLAEIRLKGVSLEEGKMLAFQIYGENGTICGTAVFFKDGYLVISNECCC